DAALLHHRELLLRRALAAGNDRARVAHALARRRGDAGNETHDRLLHVLLDPLRRGFLVRAADLANHDDGLGLRVVVEHLHHVDVLEPVHRVAADADAARLAETELGELPDRFVGERAGARHHADRPALVDVARHDADLDLVGRDHAGAVRSHQQRALAFHAVLGADHVAHRDALGDADHQVQVRVDGFVDRRCRERRRHVDHGDVSPSLRFRVLDRAENRNALEILARLFRINAGDEAGLAVGVGAAGLGVEHAGLAGDALRHHPGVLVDQDAHFFFFAFLAFFTGAFFSGFGFDFFFWMAPTTFFAASAMLSAEMIGRPESLRIFLPRSSLVPFMRTTSGTESFTSRAAATTPAAMVSHFMMPPKMLTRMAFTFLFDS